jgi:hypothetical protein
MLPPFPPTSSLLKCSPFRLPRSEESTGGWPSAAFLIGAIIPASYIFEQNMPDLPPDLDSVFYL